MICKKTNCSHVYAVFGLLAALLLAVISPLAGATHGGPHVRDVRFVASADPQFNHANANDLSGRCLTEGSSCFNQNVVAERILQAMLNVVSDGTGVRGIVIAGDLVQNAWDHEFCRYIQKVSGSSSPCLPGPRAGFVYDGLGNHDYGDVGENIRAWVWRNRATPIVRFPVSAYSPNYSWDWDDVHFVQLNLYPGTLGLRACSSINDNQCNPYGSINFLAYDLANNVDNDLDKPIVLIHHYGAEHIGDGDGWTEEEAAAYWDLIRDYNVVAILFGHTNTGVEDFSGSRVDFDKPAGAQLRPDGRTCIPAFEVGSAKGTSTDYDAPFVGTVRIANDDGAYTYLDLHSGHQIDIERRRRNSGRVGGWCITIDSEFYMNSSTSSALETGTAERPFTSLEQANSAMSKFKQDCLTRNTQCSGSAPTPTTLDVPTLFVSESRQVDPVRIDTPMRIEKWNQ